VGQENHKTFNPYWGGIQGRHWFDWWVADSVIANTPSEWREQQGISYAVIDENTQQEIQADDTQYFDQMLHLRDFTDPSRSPSFAVYRLWKMQHQAQARFGDQIVLTGYDQDSEQVAPGESVNFRFYWQAADPPPDNYSLFLHLLPPDSDVPIAQADGAPARPERPTLSWNEPSETLISQPFTLSIPPDTAPGIYRVAIGLYNYQTGQRLPITDAATGEAIGDSLPVTLIEVSG
jgi:hypothetical protein